MAQQTINIGASPNDGTGTPLRTAFQYTNSNFSELYTAVGPSGNNIVVPGSATITGDLTVDTSTLKVDSANNRVGVVNASPSFALDVNGAGSGVSARISSGSGTGFRFDTTRNISGLNRNYLIGCDVLNEGWFSIVPSTALGGGTFTNPIYNASYDGIHAWSDGAGSERMRLNSTGLGVGVSPGGTIGNLQVGGSSNANLYVQQGTDTIRMGVRASGRTGIILDSSNATYTNRAWYLDNVGSSGSLVIGRQGLDVITFDNSGNVGIGVTPSAWGAAYKAVQQQFGASFFTSNAGSIGLSGNCYNNGTNWLYASGNPATRYEIGPDAGNHRWFIAPTGTADTAITFTQAMTLDASGNFLVGVTSTTTPGVGNTTAGCSLNANGAAFFSHASSQALYLNTNVDGQIVSIRRSNVAVGSISVTTTGTTFNSLSDYRLKEAVAPLSGGLARISALKPSVYKWKADGSNGEGFLAHELAEVVPLAVTGEKDAVNEDGSIKAQGVDLSKVVPVLVAAIQELTARVQTLETR